MDFNEKREIIYSRITCESLIRRNGQEVSNNRCRAFWRDGKNDLSVLLNEHWYTDFGADGGGDVIDLYGKIYKLDYGKSFGLLCSELGLEQDKARDMERYEEINELANIINGYANDSNKNLLENDAICEKIEKFRGITRKTLEKFKIGLGSNNFSKYNKDLIRDHRINEFYNRIIFPFIYGGKVVNMSGRRMKKSTSIKWHKIKNYKSEIELWGMNTINPDIREVYVAEGMYDALTFAQEGFPILSSTTTSFTKKQLEELVAIAKGKRIFICMDYDATKTKAGQTSALKLAKRLWHHGVNSTIITLDMGDGQSHDVSELYQKHRNMEFVKDKKLHKRYSMILFEELREDAGEEVSFICRHNTQARQLEYKKELAEVIGSELANIMFKEGNKAPSEIQIINAIKNRTERMYIPDIGWYKYNEKQGVWLKEKPEVVQSDIRKEYKNHAKGSVLGSALINYKVDPDVIKEQGQINAARNLFNTKDGFVNLTTKELIPHKKEYYSTIQSDFGFHITEDYSFAENFLETISGNQPKMVEYLIDVLGELFIPDNRFQSAHFHIGQGSNGKSVFLDIMQYIVGSRNRTTIGLHDFDKHFKIIHLKDSMLNVATENNNHKAECESIFKQVTVGDEISGCFKGKDFVQFKTRAKFHFAMNKMPTIYDKSKGATRRMRICTYPIEFVENPVKTNQVQSVLGFEKETRANINQFMNIAIDSYQQLMNGKKIAYPPGHFEALDGIREASNPLISFVEEIFNPSISTHMDERRAYEEYKVFCENEGHRPQAKNNFLRNMSNLENIDYEKARKMLKLKVE